jgi:hypothetical protein
MFLVVTLNFCFRHKDRDRGRERASKKRWKEETNSRRKTEPQAGTDFPKTAFSITTSASASQISMPGHQKASIHIDTAAKMRSASVDGGTTVTVPLEHGDLLGRAYDGDNNDNNSRRQSSPVLSDSGNGGGDVITASLKIPVPSATSSTSFALNLDDADIPYIEDGGGGGGCGGGGGGGGGGFSITTDSGRQHMTIGKCNHN